MLTNKRNCIDKNVIMSTVFVFDGRLQLAFSSMIYPDNRRLAIRNGI